jgi:hypothetical protein
LGVRSDEAERRSYSLEERAATTILTSVHSRALDSTYWGSARVSWESSIYVGVEYLRGSRDSIFNARIRLLS